MERCTLDSSIHYPARIFAGDEKDTKVYTTAGSKPALCVDRVDLTTWRQQIKVRRESFRRRAHAQKTAVGPTGGQLLLNLQFNIGHRRSQDENARASLTAAEWFAACLDSQT